MVLILMAAGLAACGTTHAATMPDTSTINYAGSTSSAPHYVTAYSLEFSGFAPEEIEAVEETLITHPEHRHWRLMESTGATQRFWFESTFGSAELNSFLVRFLRDNGYRSGITYSGRNFTIERY